MRHALRQRTMLEKRRALRQLTTKELEEELRERGYGIWNSGDGRRALVQSRDEKATSRPVGDDAAQWRRLLIATLMVNVLRRGRKIAGAPNTTPTELKALTTEALIEQVTRLGFRLSHKGRDFANRPMDRCIYAPNGLLVKVVPTWGGEDAWRRALIQMIVRPPWRVFIKTATSRRAKPTRVRLLPRA